MARIDRQWGDDGQDRPLKVRVEEALLLGREIPRAQQAKPLGGEQRLELIEEAPVLLVAEPPPRR